MTLSLHDLIQHHMNSIELKLQERLFCQSPFIQKTLLSFFKTGGKRLRPLIALQSYYTLAPIESDMPKDLISLCISLELIHMATLIHDDVIDESTLRRSSPSMNLLFGNKTSILLGDFLLTQSFKCLVEGSNPALLQEIAEGAQKLCEGEIRQLNESDTSLQGYRRIIGLKTASLFAAACRGGALCYSHDETIVRPFYFFGHFLGLAFQILDDLKDYVGTPLDLGKTCGTDFLEHKITLPALLVHQRDPLFFKTYFGQIEALPLFVDFIKEHNIEKDCVCFIQRYSLKALSFLNSFKTKECSLLKKQCLSLFQQAQNIL